MKTSPSAGFTTHIDGQSLNLCFLIRIERLDGTVFGFTNLDTDIKYDDGAGEITYRHAPGVGRSAIDTSADLSVDDTEFSAFFESAGVTKVDIRDGLWDYASVKVYLVNYTNLTQGALKIRRGFLGEVSISLQMFSEIRGMMQKYVNEMVELVSPLCRADLGDARCKIDVSGTTWSATLDLSANQREPFDAGGLTPEVMIVPTSFNDRWFEITTAGITGGVEPTWNTTLGGTTNDGTVVFTTRQARIVPATVATVTNQMEFTVTASTDAPDDFFQGGWIDWVTGDNALGKVSRKGIAVWTVSTKTIRLYQPATRLIQVGDTLTLHVGCDHIRDGDCTTTFDNVFNYRAEPDLPGHDKIFQFPDVPPDG